MTTRSIRDTLLHEGTDVGRAAVPIRILVADDDKTSRLMLESVLVRAGYDVTSVEDGQSALELLTRKGDCSWLAILDRIMPRVDGLSVCRSLRDEKKGSSVYVIMLSSKDRKQDIVEGLDAGANDYIGKPFEPEDLYARVRVGCRMLQLQASLEARIRELEDARKEITTLHGMIPICMCCHRIRDDADYWHRLEGFLQSHADVRFSHGFCPECASKVYPEVCATAVEDHPQPGDATDPRILALQVENVREEMDRKYGNDGGDAK